MATKTQRNFLKENLNSRFEIRKDFCGEQVYLYYINVHNDYGYERLGSVEYVIESIKKNEEWTAKYRKV